MPIQFCCTRCGQPIEVDDVHAGQTAACPYCRSMVRVPPESTYRPGEGVTARPLASGASGEAAAPPLPSSETAPSGPTWTDAAPPISERQRLALRLGKPSFACALLGMVLLAGAMIYGATFGLRAGRSGQPANLTNLEAQMEELMKSHPEAVVINAIGTCGSVLFGLVGLGLGIASLVQSRTGNWPGWAGLIGSAALLLCLFSTVVLSFVLMGMPAAAGA